MPLLIAAPSTLSRASSFSRVTSAVGFDSYSLPFSAVATTLRVSPSSLRVTINVSPVAPVIATPSAYHWKVTLSETSTPFLSTTVAVSVSPTLRHLVRFQ